MAQSRISDLRQYMAAQNCAPVVSDQCLIELQWYLERQFQGKPIKSVESGCGETTLLFSAYVASHVVLAASNDTPRSLAVQSWPHLDSRKIDWCLRKSVLLEPLELAEIDIALINGAQAYPFPDSDFHLFKSLVKTGGIFFVTSATIETTAQLCRFIGQEDEFRTLALKTDFAVFQKTGPSITPAFWWNQRINARNYKAAVSVPSHVGLKTPVKLNLKGGEQAWRDILRRGFVFHEDRLVTDGTTSTLKVHLASHVAHRVFCRLSIQPIGIKERTAKHSQPGYLITCNSVAAAKGNFESEAEMFIEFEATPSDNSIEIEIYHTALLLGRDISGFSEQQELAFRLPSFYLNSMIVLNADIDPDPEATLIRTNGTIATFSYRQKCFSFFVENPNDSVTSFHLNGQFYEADELEMLEKQVRPNSRILEVGAHVGNHTVFFNSFLSPSQIVVMEPNETTRRSLLLNLRLNNVEVADTSKVQYALGRVESAGEMRSDVSNSSGSAYVADDPSGNVIVKRGDDLFAAEHFDFIKIDVEGMELDVLLGLRNLIERCKPTMFIEVVDSNKLEFDSFLASIDYSIKWQGSMYPGIGNYLISEFIQSRKATD